MRSGGAGLGHCKGSKPDSDIRAALPLAQTTTAHRHHPVQHSLHNSMYKQWQQQHVLHMYRPHSPTHLQHAVHEAVQALRQLHVPHQRHVLVQHGVARVAGKGGGQQLQVRGPDPAG
jgi:hypothetical protein